MRHPWFCSRFLVLKEFTHCSVFWLICRDFQVFVWTLWESWRTKQPKLFNRNKANKQTSATSLSAMPVAMHFIVRCGQSYANKWVVSQHWRQISCFNSGEFDGSIRLIFCPLTADCHLMWLCFSFACGRLGVRWWRFICGVGPENLFEYSLPKKKSSKFLHNFCTIPHNTLWLMQ